LIGVKTGFEFLRYF